MRSQDLFKDALYRELRRDLIITRITSDFKSVETRPPYHQTARKILNLLINRALDSKDFSLFSSFFSDFSRTLILTTSASSISSRSFSSLSHCVVLIGPLVE